MPLTNPVMLSGYATGNTTQSSQHTLSGYSMIVRGSNAASVGFSNGSMIVDVPAGGATGALTLGMSNLGNTAGTSGLVSSRYVLVGTNNITLSQSVNGQSATLSISGAAPDGGVFAGVSTMGNTAGSTGTVSTGPFVLVGSNGISLSQSTGAAGASGTVTINGWAATASQWAPYAIGQQGGGAQQGQGTMHIAPVSAAFHATFDRVALYMSRSNATNSTGSATISAWFGLYTRNASTLSQLTSASASFALSFHGTGSSYSQHGGPKLMTIGLSTSVTPGEYWAAIITSTTSGGADCTWNQMLLSQFTAAFSGVLGGGSNASNQEVLGKGIYSTTTNAVPASVPFTDIRGSLSIHLRAPVWLAANGTV